ncbi:hypothetical protein D3C72_88550 [compost metagenome]
MKLLLWAGLIVAVIWILRSKKSSKSKSPDSPPPPPSPSSSSTQPEIEAMLSCAHCKVHFPASEAVRNSSDQAFCSDEHRRQYVAR